VLSVAFGIGTNIPRIKKYLDGEFSPSFLSKQDYPTITFISLAETEEYFFSGKALFIDSRTREKFQSGRISGAVNIPYEDSTVDMINRKISGPLETTLVIYCDGGQCQTSVNLAKILHETGFRDIKVFFGGWDEWAAAGLPVQIQNDQE
jgi:rhodanese-related sulfurtransferase